MDHSPIMAGPHSGLPNRQIKNIEGQRFGRLLVKRFLYVRPRRGAYWLCACDCGKQKTVWAHSLRTGQTKSCGCGRFRHGKSGSKVYWAWHGMIQRCENPKHRSYKNYGARGITVCEQWHDFLAFYVDMGDPPAGLSLERIDNDGNYEPGNCRWATQPEQHRNRQHNHRLTFQGKTQCLSDWAKELRISKDTLLSRLRRGWSVDRAVTEILDR